MTYRNDCAALRERVDQLEVELAQVRAGRERTQELERQLAWARSKLTRLEDARSRQRAHWTWRAAIAIVPGGGGLALLLAVTSANRGPATSVTAGGLFTEPPDLESRASADLGCPREQLYVGHFGENQRVITGCGKCAHYSYTVGLWGLGPSRVLDPESLKYTCNRSP